MRRSRLFRSRVFMLGGFALLVGLALSSAYGQKTTVTLASPASAPPEVILQRLREAAKIDALAFERLAYLCDRIGPRLAGSAAYNEAARWTRSIFEKDGLDNPRLEGAKTMLWVRGRERLQLVAPYQKEIVMLGLGESVGTPGIEAPLAVVHDFSELGPQVKGKIVLYAPPVAPELTSGQRYGIFSRSRSRGPAAAAVHGALALLVRSVPLNSLATPHTGTLQYEEGKPKIPGAALTAEDTEWLDRLAKTGVEIKVRLEMEAHDVGEVDSSNVVAEITGSEKPDEIVLIGAHLDSWDVGQGAHDDGAGVIHVMETMRLIKALGVAPKRTIRAVLFVNEEHGLDGGIAYAAAHGADHHLVAIETDSGAGKPVAWGVSGKPAEMAWFLTAAQGSTLPVEFGGGGADISLITKMGVMGVGLHTDHDLYFDIHHTNADTLDKVDPQLLRDGVTALATLTWQLANLPMQ